MGGRQAGYFQQSVGLSRDRFVFHASQKVSLPSIYTNILYRLLGHFCHCLCGRLLGGTLGMTMWCDTLGVAILARRSRYKKLASYPRHDILEEMPSPLHIIIEMNALEWRLWADVWMKFWTCFRLTWTETSLLFRFRTDSVGKSASVKTVSASPEVKLKPLFHKLKIKCVSKLYSQDFHVFKMPHIQHRMKIWHAQNLFVLPYLCEIQQS